MIISNNISRVKVPIPVAQCIGGPSYIGKIKLKNIYQQWSGQTYNEIKEKHTDNPFNVRIGLPQTDKQLLNDRIFLFTRYLSYNPLTKQLENRELIPSRNVEKVYIGHSPEEHLYGDYRLFVDGKVVLEDIVFKNTQKRRESLIDIIVKLEERIQNLEFELKKLKRVNDPVAIYKG